MANPLKDPDIRHVYVATLALGLAYGVALSVIAIYLDERGFSKSDIGTLAAWFAGGIVCLSLPAGALIRRFSAKWVVTSAVVAYAIVTSLFPHANGYYTIAGLRFIDGAASVCIWVSCETILLARAQPGQKALVTSLYAVFMAAGYILGPLVCRGLVSVWPLSTAFVVAGALAALTAAYLLVFLSRRSEDGALDYAQELAVAGSAGALTTPTSSQPTPLGAGAHAATTQSAQADVAGPRATAHGGETSPDSSRARGDLGNLNVLWRIKTSCFATFAYGYFQASVVLFLPLYLMNEKGVAKPDTIYVTACFALGMVLFTNPAGRVGDRIGHLLTMRALAILGTAMIASFTLLDSFPLMLGAVFVAGATLASISPMSLALQGLVVPAKEYSRATAIYNAFYAAGMLVGPPISSWLFDHVGGAPMLEHLVGLWILFILFTLVFRRDDPAFKAPRKLSERPAS